jgi:hypothetical protein
LNKSRKARKTSARQCLLNKLAEAEGRAAAWLRNTKKHSGFAGGGEVQTGGQKQKKMHAGAR